MYKRHGSLFQSKIRRKVVDTDDYYTRLIVYIHQNPVKHRFVKKIDDWPHSSFSLFASSEPTFVNRDEVLSWFGGIHPFLQAHQVNIDQFF
jgi:putative transposase